MAERQRRGGVVAGLALIGLGLAMYVVRQVEGIGHAAILFLAGGLFLGGYFYRREYGYLIPGCLLIGLGAGSIPSGSLFSFGSATYLGLGGGFIAIFVIGWLYQRRSEWWPLIPGTVLIAIGLPNTKAIFSYLTSHWPLILVIFGVFILIGGLAGRRPS